MDESNLHDTLKNINDALDQWDKITNKPLDEQVDSREAGMATVKSHNQELFLKLKNQLDDLSEEVEEETPYESVNEPAKDSNEKPTEETITENHDHL